jgi:hypothetical protein
MPALAERLDPDRRTVARDVGTEVAPLTPLEPQSRSAFQDRLRVDGEPPSPAADRANLAWGAVSVTLRTTIEPAGDGLAKTSAIALMATAKRKLTTFA